MAIASADTLPDIQLEVEDVSLKDVVVTARKSRSLTSASNGKIRIHVAQSYLTDIGTALDVLKHSPGILVSNKGDISLATIGGTSDICQWAEADAKGGRAIGLSTLAPLLKDLQHRDFPESECQLWG